MRTGELGAERGFTYLWLLFVLALGGVALAALGDQALTRARREREAELRFRGQAIARALALYAERTPVGSLPLPQRLDVLLADPRFPKPLRHLRQLYTDPFTGRADWELVWGQAAPVEPAEGSETPPADTAPKPSGRKGSSSAAAQRHRRRAQHVP
jgi:type II secretory pathway pseudopilin PulG